MTFHSWSGTSFDYSLVVESQLDFDFGFFGIRRLVVNIHSWRLGTIAIDDGTG
jgi:hypothetical protein